MVPSPNMDSSSLARHQTWRAWLNIKRGATTDREHDTWAAQVPCYKKIILLSLKWH